MQSQWFSEMSKFLDALEQITGEPGDLTTTLQYIAQTAKKFFSADACVILPINPITNKFIGSLTVSANLLKRDNLSYKQPGPEGVTQQVLKQGVLLVENLEVAPEYQSGFTRTERIHAFAGLALFARNRQQCLGILYLDFRRQQQFSRADYELLQTFADRVSFVLQETWLLRRYQEVARIGQEINQELDTVEILFEKLRKHIGHILDTNGTLLLAVYQPQTNALDLYLEEQGSFTLRENAPLEGACQYVIETQQLLYIREMGKEVEYLEFKPILVHTTGIGPGESLIFVPMVLRDIPLGVLSVQHPQPSTYNQEDLSILQLLANHIALALHNMRLYRSLGRLNETGQLLTQQLDTDQVLQATTDQIRDATKADIVVLYPYAASRQQFLFPPRVAGALDASFPQGMGPRQPNDIAALALQLTEPIFAKESNTIYSALPGDVRVREANFQQRERIRSTVVIPLRVGIEAVGVLFVNFRQAQRFDATQKLFIEGLAHYAAIAIKNAQRFGTLSQRRIRELEILQNIDRELSRILDLKSLLNTLLKLAREQVSAEEASILLYNSRLQALEIPAAIGPSAENRQAFIIPLQETRYIARWVLEHKEPARVDNVHRDSQWRDLYIAASENTVSELDVPLLDGEDVVGVLNFESAREAAFSREDEHFLLTLAGQAVLAIKNAQAYEREKRLAEERQVLNDISKEITSQLDLDRVFDLILEKALELTHSDMGNLMLYDPDLNDFWMAAERGVTKDKKGQRQGLHRGVVGYAARHKQLLNVDVTQPPWNKIYMDFYPGAASELAVPMLEGNHVRGVLNIESPSPHNFGESDERLLQGLADLAVVALQNAERYEMAEREAQRLALLYQAGQELGKITELTQLEQAFDIVLHIAAQYCDGHVVIRQYDIDTQELVVVRASDHASPPLLPRMKFDEGLNGQVASEQHTIIIYDNYNPPPDVIPAKLSNPAVHSLIMTPIMFKERYYGNLGLNHKDIARFRDADKPFVEGLAQQLAITIYRLEFEQRARDAEVMSEVGQLTFELTHPWDSKLGLVRSYVNDILSELDTLGVTNPFISGKLERVVRVVGTVLDSSKKLKQAFAGLGETVIDEPVVIPPGVLLEEAVAEARAFPSLLPTIQISLEIGHDVGAVRVIHGLVSDILRNLVTNAIEAMPDGGKITLVARSAGRFVALDVIDAGVGISPGALPKIFNLFYSTKGSSGFGLWSARSNARKNHGDLRVESQEGRGTTFTLLLPRAEKEHHGG